MEKEEFDRNKKLYTEIYGEEIGMVLLLDYINSLEKL